MKSTIKIDFDNRGNGIGMEPVIVVDIVNSPDVRDRLLKSMFEAMPQQILTVKLSHQKEVVTADGSAIDRRYLLYRPELNLNTTEPETI